MFFEFRICLLGVFLLVVGISQAATGWMGNSLYLRWLYPILCIPGGILALWFGITLMRLPDSVEPQPQESEYPDEELEDLDEADGAATANPADDLIEQVKERQFGKLLYLVMGVAIFAIMGFFSGQIYNEIRQASASEKWPESAATIIGDHIETNTTQRRGRRSTSYELHAQYDYVVDGKQYEGTRITFAPQVSSSREELVMLISALRNAPDLTARYRPDDPSDSVLIPGTSDDRYVVAVVFVIGAAVSLIFAGYHLVGYLGARRMKEELERERDWNQHDSI